MYAGSKIPLNLRYLHTPESLIYEPDIRTAGSYIEMSFVDYKGLARKWTRTYGGFNIRTAGSYIEAKFR